MFAINNPIIKASDRKIVVKMNTQKDGRALRFSLAPAQYYEFSVNCSTPFVFKLEGSRDEQTGTFMYRMSYYFKDLLVKDIVHVSTSSIDFSQLLDFSYIHQHDGLQRADGTYTSNTSTYPYTITVNEIVIHVSTPAMRYWCLTRSRLKALDSYESIYLSYAADAVIHKYEADTGVLDGGCLLYTIAAMLGTTYRELNAMVKLKQRLVDETGQACIASVITIPSLRLCLFKLHRHAKAILKLVAHNNHARDLMLQRSRRVNRQRTHAAWSALRSCLQTMTSGDHDYMSMSVDGLQRSVMRVECVDVSDVDMDRIKKHLIMIGVKCVDKAKLYDDLVHTVSSREVNMRLMEESKRNSEKIQSVANGSWLAKPKFRRNIFRYMQELFEQSDDYALLNGSGTGLPSLIWSRTCSDIKIHPKPVLELVDRWIVSVRHDMVTMMDVNTRKTVSTFIFVNHNCSGIRPIYSRSAKRLYFICQIPRASKLFSILASDLMSLDGQNVDVHADTRVRHIQMNIEFGNIQFMKMVVHGTDNYAILKIWSYYSPQLLFKLSFDPMEDKVEKLFKQNEIDELLKNESIKSLKRTLVMEKDCEYMCTDKEVIGTARYDDGIPEHTIYVGYQLSTHPQSVSILQLPKTTVYRYIAHQIVAKGRLYVMRVAYDKSYDMSRYQIIGFDKCKLVLLTDDNRLPSNVMNRDRLRICGASWVPTDDGSKLCIWRAARPADCSKKSKIYLKASIYRLAL